MNTSNYAETLLYELKKDGYKPAIIFGRMSKEERDEYTEKFRRGDISVIITTNLLARGFDMQQIKLTINFDVPTKDGGKPDYENYMHRVGRSGRFGDTGLALTLFDREQDEAAFWEIVDHYGMKDMVKPLEGGAKQLNQLILEALG